MPVKRENYAGIDPGIRQIVRILAENGVETCQSCAAFGPFGEGSGKRNGDPHSYPKRPTRCERSTPPWKR